jgi:Zn-dependent protease
MHELCHSLVAMRFGVKVREITLLPIGGVASMTKMPEKPLQELLMAVSGPLFNLAVVIVMFYPLKYLLGPQVLFHPLSTRTWPLTFAYVYWLNLILAVFNMLPAFPMDGGRALRALLSTWLGFHKATKIAVTLGHIFSLIFAYLGIVRFNIILIVIAVFIYMAASNEEIQADVKETLKKYKVRDILPHEFLTVKTEDTLARVLELIFHSHQEDFPVMEGADMAGFLTRQDIMGSMHAYGPGKSVKDVMRTHHPKVRDTDSLIKAQNVMQEKSVRALPVMAGDKVVGVITLEDIGRIYSMVS